MPENSDTMRLFIFILRSFSQTQQKTPYLEFASRLIHEEDGRALAVAQPTALVDDRRGGAVRIQRGADTRVGVQQRSHRLHADGIAATATTADVAAIGVARQSGRQINAEGDGARGR